MDHKKYEDSLVDVCAALLRMVIITREDQVIVRAVRATLDSELTALVDELCGRKLSNTDGNWHYNLAQGAAMSYISRHRPELCDTLMAELEKRKAPEPGNYAPLPWEGGDESGMRGR